MLIIIFTQERQCVKCNRSSVWRQIYIFELKLWISTFFKLNTDIQISAFQSFSSTSRVPVGAKIHETDLAVKTYSVGCSLHLNKAFLVLFWHFFTVLLFLFILGTFTCFLLYLLVRFLTPHREEEKKNKENLLYKLSGWHIDTLYITKHYLLLYILQTLKYTKYALNLKFGGWMSTDMFIIWGRWRRCRWCAWSHGVHGTWCMVHGAWYMVVVHGTWCMVHGAWYMVVVHSGGTWW